MEDSQLFEVVSRFPTLLDPEATRTKPMTPCSHLQAVLHLDERLWSVLIKLTTVN